MILVTGAGGYIGKAFVAELARRHEPFRTWRPDDYAKVTFDDLCGHIRMVQPSLVINCAAFIPKPSVSLCDKYPEETIRGNVILPTTLAHACESCGATLAHISTGCLWNDGKVHYEDDPPQRAFKGYCGFYVGTKVLAEQEVRKFKNHYIWRMRLPFDHIPDERNYLTKLVTFDEVWVQCNSMCHRGDFVKACLDLWHKRAEYGTYHMNNPGAMDVIDILNLMNANGLRVNPTTLVGNKSGECKLSASKLLSMGVKIRPLKEAIQDSIERRLKEELV